MQPLDKTLRNQLERTVKQAREIAEAAAQAVLGQLGVGEAAAFEHLSEDEKALRRKLRVHGRQLGDALNGGKVQSMDRLVKEVAYEHWHRMLFARFLAENSLLMYDGVAVTLEECEELAPDEGAANGWELAARLAAKMLPQIFRVDSSAFQLQFAANHQLPLEKLLAELPREVFTASDSLGWVYQFWQANNKEKINKSEVKIGARELPAVTQLFTEPYMVSFLLDNSLGAWWAARRLTESDLKNARSEEELRQKAAIPGVPLEYLRFVRTQPHPQPLSMNGEGGFKPLAVVAGNYVSAEKLERARQFRQEPTEKEALVWGWLRNRGILNLKWRRQQVIEGFIADFYCAEHHLALEIDGDVHNTEEAVEYDAVREGVFAEKGIKTLRIKNSDCSRENLEALISKATSPLNSPSMNGEGTSNLPCPPLAIHGEGGRGGEVVWSPAAGTFDAWPDALSELKTLDPCCGSGHFLVAAFLMLVPMRMELEELSAQEAVNAVLRENIHGLELDQRCVELAAFALALTAWNYPDAGGYRPLPELNIACSGLSVRAAKEEWQQLGLGRKNLALALDWMHTTFADAPVLGSLLNPAKTDAAKLVQWQELSVALEQALSQENGQQSDEQQEAAVVAQGLAKAASLLAGQYQWVITNVPYLARGKQSDTLRKFCEQHYPAAKNDLATVFLDRCLELTSPPSPLSMNGEGGLESGGTVSVVMPQNWLFLTSYKKFREKLLKKDVWHLLARLGPQAFQTPMWDFNVQLINLSRGKVAVQNDGLFAEDGPGGMLRGVDVSEPRTAAEKAAGLLTAEIKSVKQAKQLENPDATIVLSGQGASSFLSNYADAYRGQGTGDTNRFIKCFWEPSTTEGNAWVFLGTSPSKTCHYTGCNFSVLWEDGEGQLAKFQNELAAHGVPKDGWRRGWPSWGIPSVRVSQMGTLPASHNNGDHFDSNCAAIVPKKKEHLNAIWTYCSSKFFNSSVREMDQSLKVTSANLLKVPFDLDHWTKVAAEEYPNGLPKPYTNDPTQWIFHGHPCGSVVWDEERKWTAHGPLRTDDSVLQVAVARLLGYRWPAELDAEMELADEQREWVNRCEALLSHADDDGIVCIPPVRGEAAASDRLLNLLAAAYSQTSPLNPPSMNEEGTSTPPCPPLAIHGEGGRGGEVWSTNTLAELLKNANHAGKNLETWLREKFFTQHCKLFQHRPFIWHIWDGLRDGFAALVNYHKLDHKLLETLIYTYLGDWISRQKQDIASSVDGAQEKLAAAESLKEKLELILAGEAPYDIFVRWKPLEQQPIGWNPDLNDGVRMNIRPFISVPDVKKKGAGVLRDKPNVKWGKDRGKDVESAPWYHLFNGDRINDHHLSLVEKKAALEASRGGTQNA